MGSAPLKWCSQLERGGSRPLFRPDAIRIRRKSFQKPFGRSEWEPNRVVPRVSNNRGEREPPCRHFALPRTRNSDLSAYFPNRFSSLLGE